MNFKWGLTLFLYALKSFKYLDKVVKFKSATNEPFQDDDDDDEGDDEDEVRTDLAEEAKADPPLTNGNNVDHKT